METSNTECCKRFAFMAPLSLALLFAFSASDNVMTDLIVYQTCRTITGFNDSECNLLHNNSSSKEAIQIEKLVQPYTGVIIVSKSCIELLVPTILSLFLGPWSDKNGRKPLFVFPFIGYALYYGACTGLSCFNVNPYWFLIPSLLTSFLGGFPTIFLTFFSYTSDITDNENRSWYLACLDATFFLGLLAGIFVGPALFKAYGYVAVFALSEILCLFAVLYAIFFVVETVHTENQRTFKSIFDFSLVQDMFSTITKQRDGFDRCLIWSCIAAIAIHYIKFNGNNSIQFLFASSKLGWDISQFSTYSAIHLTISVVGMLLLIKFVGTVLKLPEIVIIIISCLADIASNIMRGFIWKPWHMYFCSSVGMFNGATVPIIRSIISKSVPQKNVGKIFSITTTTEMVLPFVFSPLYMYIYTHTLNQYPSPVWFLSATLAVIIFILAIIIGQRWKKLREWQYTPFISQTN